MESTSTTSAKRKTSAEPDSSSKRMKTTIVENICEKVNNHLFANISENRTSLRKLLNSDEIRALGPAIQTENMIMKAAQKNLWKEVEFFVSIGVNISFRDSNTCKTLSDIAYEKRKLGSLAKILDADGPYPTTTKNGEIVPVAEKVLLKRNARPKAAVKKRLNMHKFIEKNNIEKIKQFVKENRKLKHVYKAGNRSALSTALEKKRFEIYSFLKSKGFKSGIDRHFQRLEQKLTDEERSEIRDSNRKNYRRPQSIHIYELVNKSRPAYGSESKKFVAKVRRIYKKLDSITELQPILKIVAESDEADIVFDFNSNNVHEMDPTASTQTSGLCYQSGYILIGASRDESDILGTVIHELMHFAMQLVFENNCLPFYNRDLQERGILESFVDRYSKPNVKSISNIIAGAFQGCYKTIDRKIAEIIVRPAQLIAIHNGFQKVPSEISQTFEDLFDYFKTKALVGISDTLLVLKEQKAIKTYNQHLDFFEQYKESKIYCEKSKRSFGDITGKVLIRSRTTQLVAANLVKHLEDTAVKVESKYLFTDLDTLLDRKFDVKFFSLGFKPTLVVVVPDKNRLDAESLLKISSKCGTETSLILIANSDDTNNQFFNSNFVVNYNWNDLEDPQDSCLHSSKRTLQKTAFKLHKREIALNMFMMPDSVEIIKEPLFNILKLVQTTDYTEELPSPFLPFSIRREFKNMAKKRSKYFYTENIADYVTTGTPVIIADVAGMGKSTSAIEIANLLKKKTDNWIAFIDLKNHVRQFKKDCEKPLGFDVQFFSERIFQLNSKPEIKFLFESMYKGTKVTFIIDGFDEISPVYKKFVLELLTFIKDSRNRLLVTTRVHLRFDLENHLKDHITFNLLPLEENDRINFIAKYWASEESKEAALMTGAEKMLNDIQASFKSKQKRSDLSQFFGVPMHLYMLADQTMDQIDDIENFNFNVYDLYYKFVSKKLKHCEDHGGKLADDDRESLSSFNKFEVYHKVALEFFLDKKSFKALSFDADITPLSYERISSQGLLRDKDGKLEFLHTSYAEFFVADYILMQLGKSITTFYDTFFKILMNEKFENVRKFLNEGLNPNSQVRKLKIVAKDSLKGYLTDKVNDKNAQGLNNRKLLRLALSENQIELLKFILNCLICTQKKKVEILTNKFRKDRTIHLSVTESGTEAFDLLFDWLGQGLKKNILEKILACKGKDNDTIRDRARSKNNTELIRKISEKSKVLNLKQRTLFSYFSKIAKP